MIVAELNIKKIPEKCSKCKFKEPVYGRDCCGHPTHTIVYYRCLFNGIKIKSVFDKELGNWTYKKPSKCPLKEV